MKVDIKGDKGPALVATVYGGLLFPLTTTEG